MKPDFKFLKCIGKGSFGAVFKVRELTGDLRLMAIKRVHVDPNYANRELEILRTICHPNCIRLFGQFVQESPIDLKQRLHLVMEYFPSSLEEFIGDQPYRGAKGLDRLKVHAVQILQGLAYLHRKGICHRDIKPHNILVDPATNRVAICDFGSAKVIYDRTTSVTYIGSRYYRAPELLLDNEHYGPSIDIWSFGCLIAEMALGHPLFEGRNTHEQLRTIIGVLGKRAKQALFKLDAKFARLTDLPDRPSLATILADSSDSFSKFVEYLLQFEADKRPTAEEALCHSFLTSHLQNGV